jgi:hypothetical protein
VNIENTIAKIKGFTELLRVENIGFKYTINHDVKMYPAAILYGTWSVAYINKLLSQKSSKKDEEEKFIVNSLNKNRLSNGLFYPKELDFIKYPKSKEYMYLHCYNYSVGAAVELDPLYDFHSSYMDSFLNSDYLERWLNQRSLERPWEESNNIVNVASYLALCNDNGNSKGKEALYQMLEWHNKVQNPKTGGFEIFNPSRKNILQSMAGAVHNFHIHHYLNEPTGYEKIIANNIIPFLYEGPLTACLSIDFVELACNSIKYMDDTYELEQALIYHFHQLIKYQNVDGGWYENENSSLPTTANGMKEYKASSNSYATWFRLCSIGMIMITIFRDSPDNWHFRKTLGMGYSNNKWNPIVPKTTETDQYNVFKWKKNNLKHELKKKAIIFASKIIS